MNIQESGEMYLETILILSNEKGFVRSVDIADRMKFSKPSVSRAVNLLKAAGHITISDSGAITLTDSGLAIAKTIYERHNVLTSMLISLGVSDETASEDACRVEHYISEETFQAIKNHMLEMQNKTKRR